jgi:hypothetical protein
VRDAFGIGCVVVFVLLLGAALMFIAVAVIVIAFIGAALGPR